MVKTNFRNYSIRILNKDTPVCIQTGVSLLSKYCGFELGKPIRAYIGVSLLLG
ncbi:MAG: hypothetical protein ACI9DS_001651 [Glaciecola sp.]|jgi:hypothetical protein